MTAPDRTDPIPAAGPATAASTTITTPDGPFTVVADDQLRVLASGWTDDPSYLVALISPKIRPGAVGSSTSLGALVDVVGQYYAGDHTAPDGVEVVQLSGPFLLTAWSALRTVRPGSPVTYTGLAELAGRPAAVRAAASACARNAAALFVPCHRVVGSDGKMRGFRYGPELKRSLLNREAATQD